MASKSVTRVERGYSSEQLYRLSGLALLAALPLQIGGYLLHPPNEEVQQVLQATYGPAHVVLAASNDGRVSERGAGLHDDDVPATERVFPVVV